MAIKLEMDGATFTFETTEEYEAFTKLHVDVAEEEPKEETFYMIKSEYVDTDEDSDREFSKGADRMLLVKTGEDVKGLMALVFDVEVKAVDAYGEHKEGDVIDSLVAVNDEHLYEVTRAEFEAKKEAYLSAEKETKEESIKVGDVVEIIGDTTFYHDHEIGDVGEVVDMDDDDYLVVVDGHEQYVPKEDVKKVDTTAEEPQKEPQKDSFKVGDKVSVKAAFYHNFPEGTIGTIEKQSHDSTTWIVKTEEESLQDISCLSSGAGTQSIKERELTLVEEGLTIDGDVEVSNVNKIEEGDVVRTKTKYTDVFGDSVEKDYFVFVNTVCGDGDIFVKQQMSSRSVLVDAEDVEDTLELVAKAIK